MPWTRDPLGRAIRNETRVGDIHLEEAGTARLRTQTGVVTINAPG